MSSTTKTGAGSPPAVIPIAVLEDVSHLYGGVPVLRHIDAALHAAHCYLLLGPNGAGKSTLLRVLAGLLPPAFGSVTLFGEEPGTAREQVGYMSHAPMLYEEFTAVENLHYFAKLHAPQPCLAPETALAAVGLDAQNQSPVRAYSQGMRQRVSLARVLLPQPRLLLLDEPFSNMDAESARGMLDLLRAERARGCTIVLTTHQRELAEPIADTLLHLRGGALQAEPERESAR
jgi:heme ABC exporter ATP-binding subunit CcmA